MLGTLLDGLAWAHQFSDPLAWLVIAMFTAGALLEWSDLDREWARRITVGAWVLFGVFWLSLIHYYAFESKSIVEGLGTLVAVPGSLYVGYVLAKGRDSLFVLSRAIAVMGLVFLPFEAIPLFRQFIVEVVTDQTEFLMNLLGFQPEVINGAAVAGESFDPYRNTFRFWPAEDHAITYTIRIACTGIGSMAIFAGLVGAVRAPLHRKLRALAVSLPIIYVLNLIRNVFIGVSFGKQYLHVFPDAVMTLFATSDPYTVSYFVADRILAQVLSVVALVVITWLVVRELPEVVVIIEDILYLATGSEYDLQGALGISPSATASTAD